VAGKCLLDEPVAVDGQVERPAGPQVVQRRALGVAVDHPDQHPHRVHPDQLGMLGAAREASGTLGWKSELVAA
jgi:hypothetical protein